MGLFPKKQEKTSDIVDVGGKPLKCLVCGNDHFQSRAALVNTAFLTFFQLDWADKEAVCCICDQCGYVHWFLWK